MGSDAHILNYTVFRARMKPRQPARKVFPASGRIIISNTTYNHLLREDPALASTASKMFPVTVKGIRDCRADLRSAVANAAGKMTLRQRFLPRQICRKC